VLTPAGATFPYGNDPKDSNIRIAPTFPSIEELGQTMDLFTVCVKQAALEIYLGV
jgi:DNA-binding transcriptional MocR family regulator